MPELKSNTPTATPFLPQLPDQFHFPGLIKLSNPSSSFSPDHPLETDPSYRALFTQLSWKSTSFIMAYHKSLFFYKHFYDDFWEYGSIHRATHLFYFIPGFNGTPGQIKFGLPALLKAFGSELYIRSLYTKAFSCQQPTWLKYTQKNLSQKHQQIITDLKEMTAQGQTVRLVVSSSGFYDLLAVWPQLKSLQLPLVLYWVSCAPDRVSASPWEKLFYKLNGFSLCGHKWFAYPNIHLLKALNPECTPGKKWFYEGQKNYFGKNDLESRFYYKGIMWDYISTGFFNSFLQYCLSQWKNQGAPLLDSIPVYSLAATHDGFWDNSSPTHIYSTLNTYIPTPKIIFKPTSHLWVVTPENLFDLFTS